MTIIHLKVLMINVEARSKISLKNPLVASKFKGATKRKVTVARHQPEASTRSVSRIRSTKRREERRRAYT